MKNHIGYYLKLHKVKDIDIINKLEGLTNKQGYIKGLIKKDLDINNKKGVQNGNG